MDSRVVVPLSSPGSSLLAAGEISPLCQSFCLIYNSSAGGRANKLTNAKTNIIHRFELSLQYNEISFLFVSAPRCTVSSPSFSSPPPLSLFFLICVPALIRLLFSGRHRAVGTLNDPTGKAV